MAEVTPLTSKLIVSPRAFVIRLVAGVLLINLFVGGLAAFFLYRSRQQYESRVEIQTQNLSHSLNLTIAGIIDKAILAVSSVEREREKQIKNNRIDSQSINEFILDQKELVPELEGLRIANPRGQVVYGGRVVTGSLVSVADRDFFIQARNNPKSGLFISKPVFGRVSQKWVFNIVRCINNPDGSFAGIAFAAISLDYISKIFSSFDLGKNGVITLRDGELAVIVRHPIPPGGGNISGSKTVSHELRAMVQAGQTSGSYKIHSAFDAIERIFSFNKVSNYPMYINVGLATSDYIVPWRNEAVILVLLVSVFTSGSLVSAWVIYRNRKRTEVAEAELIRYHDRLEETVQERTSELEAKNVQLGAEVILRQQIEADLKRSAIIMDRMSDAVDWISKDGRYLYVNDAACRMHGYSREEMLSMSVSDVAPHFPPEAWKPHWEELKWEGHLHFETVNRTRDGHEFPVEVSANYLNIDSMEYNCAIIRDISDRKATEAERQNLMNQLSQSQKIDSIGRLAGGIAHDFNNLLTPILVYSEMLKNNLSPDSRDFEKADNIMKAADKARVLTQQLLSFGRKQLLEMKTVNMNTVIESFYKILRSTIRENIDIKLHLAEFSSGIRADFNQLEQVIMNLTINAQDAISDNGVITIETASVILDDEYVRQHAGVTPGTYLMLAVTDSGCGMSKETIANIFEPFYTTKDVGKGTGLGLATVYGIVKQHDGHIWVYSEVGKGTAFKIYFPIVDDLPAVEAPSDSAFTQFNADGSTILLVEDNEMVRTLICDLLDNCGCKLIVAEGPLQALNLSEGQRIDMLLTDVVMPDMNGPELHRKMLETHKDIKVLYMSGYTNNVIVHHGVFDEGINFIQKPFTVNELAKKIDTILSLPVHQ